MLVRLDGHELPKGQNRFTIVPRPPQVGRNRSSSASSSSSLPILYLSSEPCSQGSPAFNSQTGFISAKRKIHTPIGKPWLMFLVASILRRSFQAAESNVETPSTDPDLEEALRRLSTPGAGGDTRLAILLLCVPCDHDSVPRQSGCRKLGRHRTNIQRRQDLQDNRRIRSPASGGLE